MKDWTIAFVNYNTSVYLKWQLKILYEFNNPNKFEVIIVDNSNPHEKEKLLEITHSYNIYDNIKIIYNKPTKKGASEQHAEGMNIAIKSAQGKYFLAQDPDFFFVKKGHLAFLQSLFSKGIVSVGAPYPGGIDLGNHNFPALWGAAFPLHLIKNIDCDPEPSKFHGHSKYPNFAYDVGFKIRMALSDESTDENFVSFDIKDEPNLSKQIGVHSYETITKLYSYKGETIAYHLFRGSFTGKVIDNLFDPQTRLPRKLLKIRNRFGEFFYDFSKVGHKPRIPVSRKYMISLMLKFLYEKKKNGLKRKVSILRIFKLKYNHKTRHQNDK